MTRLSLGASAIALALAWSLPASGAQAQAPAQSDGAENVEEGEFLGTITLGESKREVQTDTAAAVTEIDQEEIDDRQASTIAELIDSVPGVSLVNGSTPSGSGINIRGFGANATFGTDQKVAVFVDGASTGAEELYRIGTQLFTDPYLYESVTVQRGTVGSFEYGSGIVGGIVLLETIDASDLTGGEPGFKWAQTLGYYSNEEGFNTSSTAAWQPTEDLELLANFSYRTQNDQIDGNGDVIGNSAFELPSYLLKGRYTFGEEGEHSLEASATQTTTAERDVPYDTFFTTTDAFGNVDRDITSRTAGLTYAYRFFDNDLVDFEAQLTYADQEIESCYVPGSSFLETSPFFPIIRAVGDADQRFETTKLTVKNASFVSTGTVGHELRYGAEVLRRDRKDAQSAPGGKNDRFALFLIDDILLADGLNLTPALRYEWSRIEGTLDDGSDATFENDALMGGTSLRYAFDSGLAVFGSWAYTESLPLIDDLENPAFSRQSETATTWETGFSFDRAGVLRQADFLAFKLNYYDTLLDDVTSYSGIAEVDLRGFEFEASYATAGGTYADFNANIVTGDSLGTDGVVDDWQRLPQDNYRLTLGHRFGEVADLSTEIVAATDRLIDIGGPEPLDAAGYVVFNVRATLRPQSGFLEGTEIRLGVENVGGTAYQPFLATRNAPGRNFKVTVSRIFF